MLYIKNKVVGVLWCEKEIHKSYQVIQQLIGVQYVINITNQIQLFMAMIFCDGGEVNQHIHVPCLAQIVIEF